MSRSKHSARWLNEHFRDGFVRQAKEQGYRSRAVYKLRTLDQRFALFRRGMTVVDLGAAPGAWSQYVAERVNPGGWVIAVDILPMAAVPGVMVIQGDLEDPAIDGRLQEVLGGKAVDVVISDMAPNMSGNKAIDQPRAVGLCEAAFEVTKGILRPGGDLVMKAFHGAGFDDLRGLLTVTFAKVTVAKPEASRSRSPEVYLVARNFKLV
jgi:23S rRNA (uridine2552-2'-O)-methyltransferase